MELRTDRLGVLLDQLAHSAELSKARMEGLTDEEFGWEPVPDMFSLRRRGTHSTPDAFGAGDWVIDHSSKEITPVPMGTIAWRLSHVRWCFDARWEWTFGGRAEPPETVVEFTPSAADTLAGLWAGVDRWLESAATLTDEQLDVPGYGQFPHGLDPQIPFIGILWWNNREFIHHMAEVALLRDLYLRR